MLFHSGMCPFPVAMLVTSARMLCQLKGSINAMPAPTREACFSIGANSLLAVDSMSIQKTSYLLRQVPLAVLPCLHPLRLAILINV